MRILKTFIKTYWKLVTPFIIAFLLFTITITHWTTEPCPNEWALYQKLGTYVKIYLQDWGLLISAFATLILILVAFFTLFVSRHTYDENKRLEVIKEMRNWAENALVALGPGFNTKNSSTERTDTADVLRLLMPKLLGFGVDAVLLGGDIYKHIRLIRKMIVAYQKALVKSDKPLNLSKIRYNMSSTIDNLTTACSKYLLK